jgi:hypothetical protein
LWLWWLHAAAVARIHPIVVVRAALAVPVWADWRAVVREWVDICCVVERWLLAQSVRVAIRTATIVAVMIWRMLRSNRWVHISTRQTVSSPLKEVPPNSKLRRRFVGPGSHSLDERCHLALLRALLLALLAARLL